MRTVTHNDLTTNYSIAIVKDIDSSISSTC